MTKKQFDVIVKLLDKATLDDLMVIGRIVIEKLHSRANLLGAR